MHRRESDRPSHCKGCLKKLEEYILHQKRHLSAAPITTEILYTVLNKTYDDFLHEVKATEIRGEGAPYPYGERRKGSRGRRKTDYEQPESERVA